MRTAIALIVLSTIGFCQTRVEPPKIDYSKYGSLSGQMIVYQNVQRKIDVLELERWRAFREEIRRETPIVVTSYVVVGRDSSWNRGCDSGFSYNHGYSNCPVSNRQRNSWGR